MAVCCFSSQHGNPINAIAAWKRPLVTQPFFQVRHAQARAQWPSSSLISRALQSVSTQIIICKLRPMSINLSQSQKTYITRRHIHIEYRDSHRLPPQRKPKTRTWGGEARTRTLQHYIIGILGLSRPDTVPATSPDSPQKQVRSLTSSPQPAKCFCSPQLRSGSSK